MAETIPHLRASDEVEGMKQALDESGAVIVEDVLDADLLARFNAEIDAVLAASPEGRDVLTPIHQIFFGAQTRHISGVAGKSRIFAEEVLVNPTILALADAVLLPNCVNYRLNVAHVLDRGPGSEQQMLHRDEAVWCHMCTANDPPSSGIIHPTQKSQKPPGLVSENMANPVKI